MNLSGKKLEFNHRNRSNPGVVLFLIFCLIISFFVLKAVLNEDIVSPWLPTAIPTRSAASYGLEADAYFQSGNLEKSAVAFSDAARIDPSVSDYIWKEGRALAYMSSTMTTDLEKKTVLERAINVLEAGLVLFPEDANLYAVLAMVYGWYANPDLCGIENVETMIATSETNIRRAADYGSNNAMAAAFYAEILLDQSNYTRAEQLMAQALEYGQPGTSEMFDVYRVQGILLETYGQYRSAIDAYERVLAVYPNMTFVLIRVGVNWRQLTEYDKALEMFARAARINDQLGIDDPLPYVAIGNTYSQTGDFFAAGLNIRKAIQINAFNADLYGRLGVNYYKARNYEAAIESLVCATQGCGAAESCAIRNCADAGNPLVEIDGLPISGSSIVYYFTLVGAYAYMHTNVNHYCEEAVTVSNAIEAMYANDNTVMAIVRDAQAICARFGY